MLKLFKSKGINRTVHFFLMALVILSMGAFQAPEKEAQAIVTETGICTDPVDVMFVLDASASMVGTPFANTKTAAHSLIAQLGTQDRSGLVYFGNNAYMGDSTSYGILGIPLTSTLGDVDTAIDVLADANPASGTNIGAGLDRAIVELNTQNTGAAKIIILVSDGQPSMPDEPNSETNGQDKPNVLAAISLAASSNIVIHTFAMNPTDVEWENLMEQAAIDTGGSYIMGVPEDIDNYFAQLLPTYLCEEPICGNDIVEYPPEECDNGVANRDGMEPVWNQDEGQGDRRYCSTQCMLYDVPGIWCGDGTQNGPEECDGQDGVGDGQYCTAECVLEDIPTEPICGDGIVNQDGEQCDDGNNQDGDGCDAQCQIEEQCEPGPVELINPSCENPEVTHESNWDIFSSVPGWSIAWESSQTSYNDATRPDDALLEFHRGVSGWQPADGLQYCELDTDWVGPDGDLNGEPASVSMSQEVDTYAGASYQLSYAFSPRPNQGAEENILSVRINGVEVNQRSAAGGGDVDWNYYTEVFTAESDTTLIEFADIGNPNSLGTFLDDVTLEILECAPEPTGVIHGYKWNDENNNGERDCELAEVLKTYEPFRQSSGEICEPLMSGWTIFIDENDNGELDSGEVSMQTDDGDDFGWYWFENLPDGEYSICEVQQTDWNQTYPANCHTVILPDGNPNDFKITQNAVEGPEYNFGNYYDPQEGCTENCGGGGGGPVPTPTTPEEPVVLGIETILPELTKTVSTSQTNPDTTISYTVLVKNSGTVDLTDVVVVDTLPSGFLFSDDQSATKTWTIGTLLAGDQQSFTYNVDVLADTPAGTFHNTVNMTSNEYDPLTAEAPVDVVAVKVAGYEVLPDTGGPMPSLPGLIGVIMTLAGLGLIKRYALNV